MDKNLFIAFPWALVIGLVIYLAFLSRPVSFDSLSRDKIHDQIVRQRDIAIQKAQADGEYKCCIKPPCTMCYMEANQWNNFQAGTCACDDLILKGEDPCPQCLRGFCESGEQEFCQI